MNLEDIVKEAYERWCLYCDMLVDDEENQSYLFSEFFYLLYEKQDNIKEIPPEVLAEALTKLTFE